MSQVKPLSEALAGPVVCSDLDTVSPTDARNLYNCPVVTKTRTINVDRGQEAAVEWEVRDGNGKVVNLTACASNIVVRFQDAFRCPADVTEIEATVVEASSGLITFDLPTALVASARIYSMQIGVLDDDDKVIFTDKGFLSVERGLFDMNPECSDGPITIGEIRLQLRDTMIENSLREIVEFSDAEIIHSIMEPIRYWNERPPPIGQFNPNTFPWRYHWLRGTIANLFKISAAWYLRNKLNVTHGGAQDDDLNRDRDYANMAMLYDKEWKEFVDAKKTEINITLCWGSIS